MVADDYTTKPMRLVYYATTAQHAAQALDTIRQHADFASIQITISHEYASGAAYPHRVTIHYTGDPYARHIITAAYVRAASTQKDPAGVAAHGEALYLIHHDANPLHSQP